MICGKSHKKEVFLLQPEFSVTKIYHNSSNADLFEGWYAYFHYKNVKRDFST